MVPIAIDARPLAVGIRPVLKLEPPFAAGLLPSAHFALNLHRRRNRHKFAKLGDDIGSTRCFASDNTGRAHRGHRGLLARPLENGRVEDAVSLAASLIAESYDCLIGLARLHTVIVVFEHEIARSEPTPRNGYALNDGRVARILRRRCNFVNAEALHPIGTEAARIYATDADGLVIRI